MSKRSYWLDLFSGKTWEEFLAHGGTVSGFRESRWKTVQKIKKGDYLICYLTGVSRFIGLLEVTSDAYKDNSGIWSDENFSSRLKVKTVIALTPDTSVPVKSLSNELSMFQDMTSPISWTGYFRGSPYKWKASDGEIVVRAMQEAKENPIKRPVDPKKLGRRPKALRAKSLGSVTVPETDDEVLGVIKTEMDITPHTEIQWILLKFGNDMGLDVWVARNDRGKSAKGKPFAELPRIRDELPQQFDDATNRTIEHIDVLWLKGNAIVAAFEIESTTSIYSGLLRMSDLVAMQPNLKIPLFIVAPDDRRNKVFEEVNRPTFSRLSPKLSEICRYISFTSLREGIKKVEDILSHVKPDYLDELSESCEVEDV